MSFSARNVQLTYSQHQLHLLQILSVLGTGGADVNAGGVDAAVTQQVRQLGQVTLQPVERPGEQVAQVVGEYLRAVHPGIAAQRFHLTPNVAAVQRLAGTGDEHWAVGDTMAAGVAQELALQAGGQQHAAELTFAPHHGHAFAGGLHGNGRQLADADAGGADGLQQQGNTGAALLTGGAHQGGVLLSGQLPILRAIGLILDAHLADAAVLPSYGPEMRGGTANCSVCISDEPIGSPLVTAPNCLIAMNGPSYTKFVNTVQPNGLILLDNSVVEEEAVRDDVKTISLPATDMATENGLNGSANMILLGRMLAETKLFDLDTVQKAMEKCIPPKRAHLIEANMKAVRIGAESK